MDVREALLGATLELFAAVGSRGATTRRIAEAAGVNEVTLFRQFGSKEALIREALQWAASRAQPPPLPETPHDVEAELTEWCRAHHLHLHRNRALIRKSMGEHEEHPDRAASVCRVPVRTGQELHAYLVELQRRGLATDDWDAHAATAMLMGALFADAVGRDVMPARYPYALRDAAARYVKLFVRAIAATSRDAVAFEESPDAQ